MGGGERVVSVAVDDLDSPWGGCSTHFSGLLLKRLLDLGAEPADYPLLVRLNPGIPWKTRGNAAIVIRVRGLDPKLVFEEAVSLALEYAGWRSEAGKAPGVVVHEGIPWTPRLRLLYRLSLTSVTTIDVAERILGKEGALWWGGRGVIGASSAIAALAPGDDYTWELIAYRRPELWGTDRCVDLEKALLAEARSPPCVFNNFDLWKGELTAAPSGPDPVLAGFRGDCPEHLNIYSIALCEEPHFWVLYRSNQHTDAHVRLGIEAPPRPYNYVSIEGTVTGRPEVLPGSHVRVYLATSWGRVQALFFSESYPLNRVAAKLLEGDLVLVHGSVRPSDPGSPPVVAVDKLVVRRLARSYTAAAPICPRCGRRMKSAGRGKGYKCPRCGFRAMAKPVMVEAPRDLVPGVYTPREGRLRHLTSPPSRRPQSGPPAPPRPHLIASWNSKPPGYDPPVSGGDRRQGPHPPFSSGG